MNSREPHHEAEDLDPVGPRDFSRTQTQMTPHAREAGWSVPSFCWLLLASFALLLASPSRALAGPLSQPIGKRVQLSGARVSTLAPPAADPTAPTSDGVSLGNADPAVSETTSPALQPIQNDPEVRIVEREELREKAELGSTLLDKHNVPPFWLHREFDTHTTKALTFPPVFMHRKPKQDNPEKFLHMDLSLTFGWYDRRKSKRRWLNPAFLFFGALDDHQSSWAALPLLMGYKRIGEKYNFGQFPLVWAWGNRHTKNLLVAPFHFQSKTPGGFQGVSALLFWYGHKNRDDANPLNDRKHFIAAPVYWDLTRGTKRWRISPIYFGGSNADKRLKHHTLLPLFHWQSREDGNHTELWTAAFIRRKDGFRGMSDWAIPPLLSFSATHGDKKVAAFTPLVWHVADDARGTNTWVIGPAGTYNDQSQRQRWFMPFYQDITDKRTGAKAGILLPFAAWQKNQSQTRVHTLLGYGRKSDDGWGFGVHPLLTYMGHRGGKAHSVVAGGLAWWQRVDVRKGTSAWGVGPLAYRTKGPDRSGFALPPLLTFTGRKGPRSWQVVTPLFVHAKNKQAGKVHNTFVVGPFYTSKGLDTRQAGLAPLFMFKSGPQAYGVVPPILAWWTKDTARGRFRFASLPFVYDKDPTGRTVGVLGLAWDAKHEIKGQTQRDSVLAPLYYRRQRGDKHFWVSPIGGGAAGPKGGGWAAGPVFAWNKKANGVDPDRRGWGFAPLLFHTKRKDAGATTVVPGLFIRDRRPESDLDMWTPFLWRSEVRGDKARKGFALVPFYFRQRQPKGYDIDAGLGFFWGRNKTRHTHTLIAGTFFHHKTRKSLHTGLLPLTYWMDSETKRRLIALPLIIHDEDKVSGRRTTLALPLWVDRRQTNGRRTWMAFPFVFGREFSYDFTRASVAPPGYFDILRLRQNFRFTGVVPFLFRYQKCGFKQGDDDKCRYTMWGSFPLFFYGKDGKGRRTHSALGLYWADKDAGGKKLYTLLGGYQYRPNERTRWYALTLYRDVTKTHATTAFIPLFYHRKHRNYSRSTTMVLPPIFIQKKRDDRAWFEAGLMVWQFRNPAKVTTVVAPPLFGHQHTYKERKLTWLAPVFVDDNNFGNDERWTSVLPGLFLKHRKGERKQIIQVPFVWHFAQKDRSTTVGVPLWYDFRRPGKRTRVVPGLYFGLDKGEGKVADKDRLHVIGPGLGWWKTGPDSKHWAALLGLFGGGHEGDQRYMHFFGRRIPLKSKAKAKAIDGVEAGGEVKPKAGKAQSRRKQRRQRRAAKAHKSAPTPAAAAL